ncbi:MAG: ligand-binding sensor domain-containing diguanylate cyclase [Congregibacter sp.]
MILTQTPGTMHRIQHACYAALLCALMLAQPVLALNPDRLPSQYLYDRFDRATGLPSDSVWVAREGPDGYLWIGTRAGLARFDGARFKVYNSLSHALFGANDIRDLEWTPDRELWIATYGGGAIRKTGETFKVYSERDGLVSNIIYDLHHAKDGSVWFATGAGISRLKDGKFDSWTTADGLLADRMLLITESDEGVIWVAGLFGGTSYFTGDGFTPIDQSMGLDSLQIHLLQNDPDHGVVVGTETGAMFQLSEQGAVPLPAMSRPLPVQRSLHDRDGNQWIGTYGDGLWRRAKDGEWTAVVPPMDRELTHIYGLSEDSAGNIWVASTRGLYRVKDGDFLSIGGAEGLSNSSFVVTGSADNGLWVGTEADGVFKVDADGRISRPIAELTKKDISSLLLRENGDLWIGTFGQGVYRRDANTGALSTLGPPQGLNNGHIFAMSEFGESVLIGTSEGVYRWQDNADDRAAFLEVFGQATVRSISQSGEGKAWISSNEGLREYDLASRAVRHWTVEDGLPSNVVMGTVADERDILWIITRDGTLSRLEDENLFSFGNIKALQRLSAFGIIEDRQANLWISGSTGLMRVARQDLDAIAAGKTTHIDVAVFDENDGLRTGQFIGGYQPAAWRGQDDRLWFVTQRGVVGFDPTAISRKSAKLRSFIEAVRVDGRSLPLDELVEVPANFRSLEIDSSAPELSSSRALSFRYTISSDNSYWEEVGNRRTAYFNTIPPGESVFRVQASFGENAFADSDSAVAELRFVREPIWYETFWAVTLATVFAILALLGIQSQLNRRARERERELQDLVELQTEELRRALARVEASARVDGLTGVANRRYMEEQLTKLWNMAKRSGAPMSILMLDIDHFKKYNDALGHNAGDRCLKAIADAISGRLLREHDMVARYGGEEFLVMLYDTDETGAKGAAERIIECVQALRIPHPDSDVSEFVTLSLGYATARAQQDSDVKALVERADKALYAAKNAGRNGIFRAD